MMKIISMFILCFFIVATFGAFATNAIADEIPIEAWVSRYDGVTSAAESAVSVVDHLGNVYVTGTSRGVDGSDYATLKYDSEGNQLWEARYDGPDSGYDYATDIAVDGLGNVYVTGTSCNLNWAGVYATVKYDSEGNQLWVARYDSPTGSSESATDIAVDGLGNVYVSGTSSNVDWSASVYATVKYDSEGNQLWEARYDAPGSGYGGYDLPTGIAVDEVGNVYVTGKSRGMDGYDYATVKYDSEGNQLWVARYHIYDGGYSEPVGPVGIAVDGLGNVYVSGTYSLDSGGDYVTVKYDSDGSQLWVARYGTLTGSSESATDIAVDGLGNVYVSGTSYNVDWGGDYATVKYDSDGNQLWVARYDGPGSGYDCAAGVAVDGLGNIYVTGTSYSIDGSASVCATVKYDSDGNQLWEARYDGPAGGGAVPIDIAVDGLGNAYVTGTSAGSSGAGDYVTVKYDSEGNQLWVARYDSPTGSSESATDIAVDGLGNVYVSGTSYNLDSVGDYATVKYDSAGNQLWVARYDGPGGWDTAAEMVVDGLGNVYVTGESDDSGGRRDYATVKYSSAGNQLWVARYDSLTGGNDEATDIAVDGLGNVYVTGTGAGSSGAGDYATVKYDGAGNQLWVARYNGPNSGDESAAGIAVDGLGNVYVTGISEGTDWCYDYATVKYDSAGNQLWVARYEQYDANVPTYYPHMAVDGLGNVYVTGSSSPQYSGWAEDYATVKYDSAGNQLWVARHDGPADGGAVPTDVAVDNLGNVYVTGWSYNADGMGDYATVKYDSEGNQLWVARYDGPDSAHYEATHVVVDGLGSVYVTGTSFTADWVANDYVTVKYDSEGNQLWAARYDGPGGSDVAADMVVDGLGNIYVTGTSYGSGANNDYATIKYVQGQTVLPRQPSNVTPSDGATGINLTPTLQSSAFSDPDVGDTHAASQWQISTSSGSYSSPVYDSGTDSSSLTSITIPTGRLNNSTTYYWHVTHQDNHGAWSSYSNETSFTTMETAPTPTPTPTPRPTPTPNTPAGSNVTVPLPSTVVTFGNVTGEGTTSVNWSADNPGGPTPPNFYVHGLFMNISTTATYTDTVNVCMGYDESGVANENNLRLFHWNGAIWEDVTTLPVDTVNNIICGNMTTLSPFFVGEPAAQVQTATGTGTARFSVSSGAIENLTAVTEGSLPTEGKPSLVFPHGFFRFDITGLSNGETVTVVMELPSNILTNAQYWKWDSTLGWHQINFSDNDGDRIIAIQLTDNGTGDSDPTPGRIHDDGGPGNPAQQPGGGGGGGGCFIATAAYGSSLDSHVDTLRSFRDQYLETNPIGSAFVSLYYKVSPPMAEFINEHPALKPIVRAGLVPAVVMSTVAINTTPMEKIAIASSLAFVCILVFVGLRRKIIRGKF